MDRKYTIVIGAVLLCLFASGAAQAEPQSPAAAAAIADIQATFGSVPTFFRLFPEEALPGAWETMKNLQLSPTTEISPKYKELIGLGVAAQIPCQYCIYFHTKAAQLNGATDREIREALAEASLTRFWSTVLNGSGQDREEFRAEITKALDHVKKMGDTPPPQIEVTDRESAYRDIENNFGFVPSFMKTLPPGVVAATWREMKDLELNPNTALPNKFKDLLSLAVSSQIPCEYCVYADRQFAKMDGATDGEISEAIGMSAITRHWSTFLNGLAIDPDTFHKEADAIFTHATAMMNKK